MRKLSDSQADAGPWGRKEPIAMLGATDCSPCAALIQPHLGNSRLPERRVETFDEKQHVATKTRPLCLYYSPFFFYMKKIVILIGRKRLFGDGFVEGNGAGK